MSSPNTTPGLTPAQLNYSFSSQWKLIVKQMAEKIRVSIPAFLVEDLNVATQTVFVQISIQERVRVPDVGFQWYDIPPIIRVPIVTPRGGGYSVTLPLKKGDEGLLVFCDMCFDNWWLNGATGPAADNADSSSGSQQQQEIRRHHVTDCGFIPGMWSQTNKLSNYSTDSMQLRSDDGTVIVDLSTTNGVTITAPKVTIIATQQDVDITSNQGNVDVAASSGQVEVSAGSQISIKGSATSIQSKDFITHVHTGVQSGGSDTGPVA